MDIVEWFNPDKIEHIEAYSTLQNSGMWPKDFIPSKVKFGPYWMCRLSDKLANIWIDYMLCEEEK